MSNESLFGRPDVFYLVTSIYFQAFLIARKFCSNVSFAYFIRFHVIKWRLLTLFLTTGRKNLNIQFPYLINLLIWILFSKIMLSWTVCITLFKNDLVIFVVGRDASKSLYIPIADHQWPIVYSPKYNIGFAGLENLHPFDSKKWGRVYEILESKWPIGSCHIQFFRLFNI